MSEEIERRLDLSFREPDVRAMFVGSNKTADLLAMIANVLKIARSTDNKNWYEDDEICNIVADAVSMLILSGSETGQGFGYRFKATQEEFDKVKLTAKNIARAACILQIAAQDNSHAVTEIPDPADFMEKHNRHKEGDEIKSAIEDALLMYMWGRR